MRIKLRLNKKTKESIQDELMEKNGIPTHYIAADVDKGLMQVRNLTVPKLEFVLRYFTAGSMCRRFTLEEGIVFERDPEVVWHCNNCGHTVKSGKAPAVCPVCAHPQAHFQIKAENY